MKFTKKQIDKMVQEQLEVQNSIDHELDEGTQESEYELCQSTLNLSKLIPNILAVETLHIKDGCEEGQIHYLNNLQDEAEFLRLLSIALKRIAKGLYVDERTYIETVPNKKFLSTKMFVYSYSEFSAIRIYTDADYLKRMFMD